ncbi:unnamed protein product [Parajaminaea phylloscopi]
MTPQPAASSAVTASHADDAQPASQVALDHPATARHLIDPSQRALIQYAVGRTLLPANIAEAVSGLSSVARVSLRATAFFLEVILEATKLGTGVGMGLTRRALVSAIGATRTMQALAGGEETWASAHQYAIESGKGGPLDNVFFSMLEKYTAVGIYVVHHTLTMTELLATSGLSLVQNSIRNGAALAEESVGVIDGIFGSNESSRALSSFIDLVRREFSAGKRQGSSALRSLSALTTSMLAFALVQAATYRRTVKTHRMSVLYDCTLLGTVQESTWGSLLVGPASFRPRSMIGSEQRHCPVASPHLAPSVSRKTGAHIPDVTLTPPGDQSFAFPAGMPASRSFAGDEPCLTDVSGNEMSSTDFTDDATLMQSLHALCGSKLDDQIDQRPPNFKASSSAPLDHVSPSQFRAEEESPRDALRMKAETGRNRVHNGSVGSRGTQRPAQRTADSRGTQTVWEVVTETMEVTETIEECAEAETSQSTHADEVKLSQVPSASQKLPEGHQRRRGLAQRIKNPFQLLQSNAPVQAVKHDAPRSDSDMELDEDEWLQVSKPALPQRSEPNGNGDRDGLFRGGTPREQPSSPVRETKQTMSVVLKRVQRKLTRTTRVISRVEAEADAGETSEEADMDRAAVDRRRRAAIQQHAPQTALNGDSPEKHNWKLASRKASRVFGKQSASTSNEVTVRSPPAPSSPSRFTGHAAPATSPTIGSGTPRETPSSPALLDKGRRHRSRSITSMLSHHTHRRTRSQLYEGPQDPEQPMFPRRGLIDNLHRFGRYASASYGHRFMSILGIGDPYQFSNTQKTHANVWAFANHVGVGVDDVLLSSFAESGLGPGLATTELTPVVNFVVVDRECEAVVLACRGTLGLSDVLVDLTCDYEAIRCASGEGNVHKGIWQSARRLTHQQGTVISTLREALEANPTFGLVTVGHSLGGGVAALLALQLSTPSALFQEQDIRLAGRDARSLLPSTPFVTSSSSGLPAGRPIHAYAYGPAAVMDADLSKATRGLITSLCHNHDVVPCLSLGLLRDFQNISDVLEDAAGETASDILRRTIGLYQRRRRRAGDHRGQGPGPEDRKPAGIATEPPGPDYPLSTDVPDAERHQTLDVEELKAGRSRNRAAEAGYVDPLLRPSVTSLAVGAVSTTDGRIITEHSHGDLSAEQEVEVGLWSLMKVMRAHAQNDKLYPPGRVYCTESFEVYVKEAQRQQHAHRDQQHNSEAAASSAATAHRVILRACDDVVARFSEPIFSRSLFRDHSPTNLEFCLSLLKQAEGRPA